MAGSGTPLARNLLERVRNPALQHWRKRAEAWRKQTRKQNISIENAASYGHCFVQRRKRTEATRKIRGSFAEHIVSNFIAFVQWRKRAEATWKIGGS